MDRVQKVALLREIGLLRSDRGVRLQALGIPLSTYYDWKQRYERGGLMALSPAPKHGRIWNRLTPGERDKILTIARIHPDLSCRLLSVKITDEEDFAVSEATVYRFLKQHGLITPRPLAGMPAAQEWQHKTKACDEIWQCDATHYFVVGWGFYKQITVLDDHSRNPLAWDLKPDETAFSISDVIEQALEHARGLGHLVKGAKPQLLSDNGSGFTAKIMDEYLDAHGIKHIFGKPYHPETQGKIERFHRTIKEKVCLLVYCSPEELKRSLDEAITRYARTPHKALSNVSPIDVYLGRKEEILRKRAEKKRLTLERRRIYNMGLEVKK
jgi:transposase InsO family protein